MGILREFLDGFWNREFWLPPNVTWADIEPNDKIQYANYKDLLYLIPLTLTILLLRYLSEM